MGAADIMELLCGELELAKQCHELTIKQKQSLDADDAEALKALLAERRGVIEKIEAARTAVAGALGGGQLDAGEKSVEDEAFSLLRQVRELDRENMTEVKRLMEKSSAEGKKMDLSRKGIGLYNQKDAMLSPNFFDRKS